MTLEAPWGYDGKTYTGKEMRQLVGSMFDATGVARVGDYLVTQQASPGPTVQVAAGDMIIKATAAGEFGKYEESNDATINSPSFSPTSGNGRWDYLILRITAGVAALEIVPGTASGSPIAPTITGDNYEPLALVKLPASTTNITTAMINDARNRAAARQALVVCTSTTRPATPYPGQTIFETDTFRTMQYQTATTGWTPPWNLPWGLVTTPVSWTSDTGTAAGPVDVTGATLTWAAIAGRRVRYTLSAHQYSTVLGDVPRIALTDGAGTNKGNPATGDLICPGANIADLFSWVTQENITSTASTTRKIRLSRGAGSGTVHIFADSTRTGLFVIEDMGPSANPL